MEFLATLKTETSIKTVMFTDSIPNYISESLKFHLLRFLVTQIKILHISARISRRWKRARDLGVVEGDIRLTAFLPVLPHLSHLTYLKPVLPPKAIKAVNDKRAITPSQEIQVLYSTVYYEGKVVQPEMMYNTFKTY